MIVRFNRNALMRALALVAFATLLGAQTTVKPAVEDGGKKPVVSKSKREDAGYLLTPLLEPKSLKKDRCDEKPRPADCDVKF